MFPQRIACLTFLVLLGVEAAWGSTPCADLREDVTLRGLNAKHFRNGDGSLTMVAHCEHVHYVAADGTLRDIDTRLTPTDAGWVMHQAGYELELPRTADGVFVFINSARLDAGGRPLPGGAPVSAEQIRFRAVGVRPVPGELVRDGDWAGKAVRYTDAYGQGIDLELVAGDNEFRKEIVFRRNPLHVGADLEFPFEVSFRDRPAVRIDRVDGRRTWDGQPLEVENPERVILGDLRQTWFRRFRLWDRNGEAGRMRVRLSGRGDRLFLTKVLDREFFNRAAYPVRTDANTSYYPGAGDGDARYHDGGPWSNAYYAANAVSVNYTSQNYAACIEARRTDRYYMSRCFFPFDTSSLPDDAIVQTSGTSLQLYVTNVVVYGEYMYSVRICLTKSLQANPAVLAASDYSALTRDNPPEGTARVRYYDIVPNQYLVLPANSNFAGWVDPTGWTKFALRSELDVTNTAFPGVTTEHYLAMNFSESGLNRPQLVVTYVRPPAPFSLSTPTSGASVNTARPAFTWQASSDPDGQAISYTLKVSTDAGFTEPVYRSINGISSNSYTLGIGEELADGSYYWKVIASDGTHSTESTQSHTLSVITVPPSSPVLSGMQSDLLTGQLTRVSGTAPTGTTLTLYRYESSTGQYVAVPGSTVWNGSNFAYALGTPLDFSAAIYMEAEDAAHNTSTSDRLVLGLDVMRNVFQDAAVYHGVAGRSMRLELDTLCRFRIAVNAGDPVTVTAWLRKNSTYSGTPPTITLTGLGISGTGGATDAMTAGADTWEQLTTSGTPNASGVLTLTVETFSTGTGAAAWVDDISVSQ